MARNITKLLMCALFCALPAAGAWADGAVYAMTNALGDNQILVYHRNHSGTLSLMQTIPTGGGGSGVQLSEVDSLASQGSLVLDAEHHLLFAVNTESLAANTSASMINQDCQAGTITSFRVADDGSLKLADRIFSGGLFPNSVAVKTNNNDGDNDGDDRGDHYGDLVYVLNAGGPGNNPVCSTSPNITGFRVNSRGNMSLLAGSVRPMVDPGPLDGTGSGVNCPPSGFPASFFCGLNPPAFPRSPAEVRFTPDGNQLVVTVKGTNSIYVLPVDEDGTAGTPTVSQAPGPALPTFFGFAFDKHEHLILTETFGTSPTIPAGGTGALSSFTITNSGTLQEISADVGDGGTATCWVAIEPMTGKYAFVSNNLSSPGTLSSYSVGGNGSLTLLAATAAPANGPNDLAVAVEGGASFLYALESLTGTVKAWRVNLADGSLTLLQPPVAGLPVNAGAQGLAAY